MRVDRQAQSVWEAYFQVYTNALRDRDVAASDMLPYLTDPEYRFVRDQLREFRNQELRLEGEVTTRGFETVSQTSSKLVALVCVDNGSSLLKASVPGVKPPRRPAKSTLRLEFVISDGKALLDKDESWLKASVC